MVWGVITSVSTPNSLSNERFDPAAEFLMDKISPDKLELLVCGSFSRFKGYSFGKEG